MNKFIYIMLLFLIILLTGCKTRPAFNGIPNFGIVDKEKNILRGGEPSKNGIIYLNSRNIKTIIELDRGKNDDYARSLGINVVNIPISTWEQIWGNNLDIKFSLALSYINTNTYFHCTFGKNRTGTLCGLYRIKICKWKINDTLKEMSFYGWNDSLPGLKWYFYKELNNE